MNAVCGEIDLLRAKLNDLILHNASFDEIYRLSVQLDQLILLFYNNGASKLLN